MKQKKITRLNPKIIKIVAVLTIWISSFYYIELPTYSKVLKGIAFCILMSSSFIESIRNKARKKKNDSFLLFVLGIVMWLTNRLEESIILLLIFQIIECLKSFKTIKKNQTVLIKKKNKKEKIELFKIKKDMILILNKGDILPVDGCLQKERNKKQLSTKSVDKIFAGTIINEDHIEVKTLQNYQNSKWGNIQSKKQQIDNTTEKKKEDYKKYTRKTLIIIGFCFILIPNFITQQFEYFSIYLGTVILLFAIQTPLQDLLSNQKILFVHKLFSQNIGIKNEQSLKKLNHIKNIVFEKTGTLTLGEFRITAINTKNEKQFLEYLNYVEYYSNHLIARTIKEYKTVTIDRKKIKDFKEVPSRGVECKVGKHQVIAGNIYFIKEKGLKIKKEEVVGTVIYLVVDHTYLGNIILSDSIKSTMKSLTQELRKFGVKNFSILSGDNEQINKAISHELKIDDQYSNLTPIEKEFWFQHLKEQKKGKTMFIANKDTSENLINLADVSILLQTEEENNMASDFYFMNNQLEMLPNLFQFIKDFKRKRHQMISFFIGLRGIWILLAFMDSLPLWLPLIVEQLIVLIINFQINRKERDYDGYRNCK